MNTLFKNANIIQPDGAVIKGCLGVQDNRIAFVGNMDEGFNVQKTIDCKGNILMPGFVNLHTHLPMSLFRSVADDIPLMTWLNDHIFPLEDRMLNPQSIYFASMLSIAEMIRSGTTCFNDMYYFLDSMADAVIESKMRGFLARSVVSASDDGDSRIKEAVDAYEKYNGSENGRLKISFSPHAQYTCNNQTLKKFAGLVDKYDALLHVHVSETFGEHESCKDSQGKTPTEIMDACGILTNSTILAHCVHVSPTDIQLIAHKKANVASCPQSNLKLGSGIAPLPVMLASKVNVGLGTDGAASNNNQDMFEEMRLAGILQKGITLNPEVMPAPMAFNMASLNGAKALRLEAGALVKGALADIVMIDTHAVNMIPHNNLMSQIVYSADSANVKMTMVDGNILYENGEFYTIDVERIMHEVQKLSEDI